MRGAAERGFAPLDTEGSEAWDGKDAEAGEEPPESGRSHTDATEVVDVSGYVHGMGSWTRMNGLDGWSGHTDQRMAHDTVRGSLLPCVLHYQLSQALPRFVM